MHWKTGLDWITKHLVAIQSLDQFCWFNETFDVTTKIVEAPKFRLEQQKIFVE